MDRNRLYRADCKVVLDQLKAEGVKVDLIYLDPPFNSNRTYSMIFNHGGVTAQQKAYHDMWDFTDSTRQLVLDFRDELDKWNLPDSFKEFMRAWTSILEGGNTNDRKLLNYLMYMTQRLVRMRDILTPTGSIYFHCDPTASHYVKVIMDGVFGRDNFQSEIVWRRASGRPKGNQFASRSLGQDTDTILYYTQSSQYVHRSAYRDLPLEDMAAKFPLKEPGGRKYHTRTEIFRQPSMGPRPTLCYEYNGVRNPHPSGWRVSEARLKEMDDGGYIIWRDGGRRPLRKAYADEYLGTPIGNLWTDIHMAAGKERLGYATQKPRALLERIISISSDHGGLVLDPFCGCGTTVHAAQLLGRRWIGIDISGDAVDEIIDRLSEISVHESQGHYEVLEGNPDTMAEYNRLNPFEKQEWLVRKLGGLPNPKKSGDHGVDGDMTFHMGADKDGNDTWGCMVFSVKTGKQRSPAHVRELRGTMKNERAQMGVLVLDCDPTPGMESAAAKAGRFSYQPIANMPPKDYDKIQIITAYEIIEKARVDCPPTMQAVKRFRKAQQELEV